MLAAAVYMLGAASAALAQDAVTNTATIAPPAGLIDSNPADNQSTVTSPVVTISTDKQSDVGNGATVQVGQTITYTATVTIGNGVVLTDVMVLVDTLGQGLTFGTVTSPGAFSCTAAAPITCTLPAGTAAGIYPVSYTAVVNPDARGSVHNAVVPSIGGCEVCETDNGLLVPVVTYTKSAAPPGGRTTVVFGDTITYTLSATVGVAPTTAVLTLTDTLGSGLNFGAVTSAGAFTCNAATPLVCTLPANTPVGTYSMTYTATVNIAASNSVRNSVAGSGGDNPTCSGTCSTEIPLLTPAITYSKAVTLPAGETVAKVGDTLAYTLSTTVSTAPSTAALTLTDTLGVGITFGSVTSAGAYTCNAANPLVCTLPAGTPVGTYPLTYTASVNAQAGAAIHNAVVGSGGDNPQCAGTCDTDTPVVRPAVTYSKAATLPAGAASVHVGDSITYTLSTTVNSAPTTALLTLTDTLGAGLNLGAVTSAGAYTCNAANPLVCTLPAGTAIGTYALTYTATVNSSATGSVRNAVIGSGNDTPTCTGTCGTDTPVVRPTVTYGKSVALPVGQASVRAGDTLTFTLSATLSNAPSTALLTLTDTPGPGLTFGVVTGTGGFTCNAGFPLVCTLPAGTAPGTHVVTYVASVNAQASGTVHNAVVGSGGDNPTCTGTCSTDTPLLVPAGVTYSKVAVLPAGQTTVKAGDTIGYTLTMTVATAPTTGIETLTDTLGPGLSFGSVTFAGNFTCNAASPLVCTLPAGSAIGGYTLTYTATVNATATGSVTNAVVGSGGDNPACSGTCTTDTPLTPPAVTYSKVATLPAGQTTVKVGDTITYTLSMTVATSPTTSVQTLTDTLGTGLAFGSVTSAGNFTCNAANPLICTLPAATAAGTYSLAYTATVDAIATGPLNNAVVGTGGDNPACAGTCSTDTPLVEPIVTYSKAATLPAGKAAVSVDDIITYTLSTTVSNSPATAVVTLTDTLGQGLTFESVTSAGAYTCGTASPLVCTLPAATPVGVYPLSYAARVNTDATGPVRNAVVGTGGDNPTCGAVCTTETPPETSRPSALPIVAVSKSSNPASGSKVERGDVIQYTLTILVTAAPTSSDLVLTDTPDPGLTLGALPAGCSGGGTTIICALPANTPTGTHTFTYSGTVNNNASASVSNVVTASGGAPEGPTCTSCTTTQRVDDAQLRVAKVAGAREVHVGDLVPYTLQVDNVGPIDLVNGHIVDSPPAGFTFVAGSLRTSGNVTLTASGNNPVRFDGLNLPASSSTTLVYLMRVGAGVRPGVQVNQAEARSSQDNPISNRAEAQVTVSADPLLDDSLIFGTVFDDRDGDGWQDSAALSEVHAQGGFAAGNYIAGSTTIDRGDGPRPVADASAPLLHGIAVGAIAARQSEADAVEDHEVVIRQRLREPTFTDDFVLTTAEGVTLRMDAGGRTTLSKAGAAAKGRNGAEPAVERRVARIEDGYEVAYVIRNAGIDERGVPGVRIASVEGLLVETDQFGRFHLVGIPGGIWERGRNFILKVDPATLPPGTTFTTDNSLLRRTTPGVPVRFDFGVKLPVQSIPGGAQQLELKLGRIMFAPDAAEVRPQYRPVIEKIAAKVREYGGGEVVIDASGDTETLAFARANAVKDALVAMLDETLAGKLTVSARGTADDPDSLIVGVDEGGALLGTVLFDTAKADIRPEFAPLLDKIARELERTGGGQIGIVGHTDIRGSYQYNTALGIRRATAVYEALATRLSPEVRAKVRVHSSIDTHLPVNATEK